MFKKILGAMSGLLSVLLMVLLINSFPALAGEQLRVPVTKPAKQAQLRGVYLAPVTPVAYIVKVAMAEPLGNNQNSGKLQRAILHNLSYLPFVETMDPDAIPGGLYLSAASGDNIDFERFRLTRTDNLITTTWLSLTQVELRAYEVEGGKFLFGTRLSLSPGMTIEDLADEFCAQFMESLTGRGDFFRATLTFVKTASKNKKDIWIVKPTGRALKQVTNIPGDAISPAWSHDGRFIIFSHIDSRTHALGVWDSLTSRVQRIRFPGNTVIGPCFMPDNKIAVSLTDGQNPSIFLLNHRFQKEKKLITSSGIDVSPSVDSSGTKMVFTSSRLGNPHIFIKDFKTNQVSRVSLSGKYNTDPSISPDGTLVVFSRLISGEGHRVFVHDLRTGEEMQISFGPGSDEQPEFAPDSYFIAFTSTRSGKKRIYLTTRHGGTPKLLQTGKGDASFPSWGLTK